MNLFTGKDLVCLRGERIVFSGLDFGIDAGGVLVLVGPNGSGKSSLLRLMAGLLGPMSGTLQWNGEALTEDPEAHNGRLHYVGHLDAVKPVLSVAENLEFWSGLRAKAGEGDTGAAVLAALEAFGIGHLAAVPGRFLSAGQKRRVNLARILAAPAPLWLLDEPTTALDKRAVAGLERAIVKHRETGGMVVLSTHTDLKLDAFQALDLSDFAPKREGGWAA
ncbi:MAG TPA: heme ABC exporter ATP-binding protein CcmA [Rhodospirillales bacterium]|nr:heme ABC exporter ATP-binding protein CcmA [Rhodospirillales bacterium]